MGGGGAPFFSHDHQKYSLQGEILKVPFNSRGKLCCQMNLTMDSIMELSVHACKKKKKIIIEISNRLQCRNKNINGASFPHLQPIAELRRNQGGEIGRQHLKAHSCSHFSPCFDHTAPTQTDDGTSQIDHDIGAYVPYSFRTMSRVLLRRLPPEVQGWRDHLNWEWGFTASMISPVLKTLVDGPAGVWTEDLPLSRPALFQLS